jgi:hypothetical protein
MSNCPHENGRHVPRGFGRQTPWTLSQCHGWSVSLPTHRPVHATEARPTRFLLLHWNSQKSDRDEMQPGVRKKSL